MNRKRPIFHKKEHEQGMNNIYAVAIAKSLSETGS